jgi:hypothetical protein
MCIALLLTLCASITFAQESNDETAVWKLENSYWDDVKALDLISYRALWHPIERCGIRTSSAGLTSVLLRSVKTT